MSTFRFRPRFRGVAWISIGLGTGLGVVAGALGFAAMPFATGILGVGLGAAYLTSRTWQFHVVTDDTGLEVRDRKGARFRVRWTEIVRVVASPSTKTCFVDGGVPERSLLVPGDGAPAPYAIEGREELFETIMANVTPERIETVETLERVTSTTKPA